MSQYIYFFIKGADQFYPIYEGSRSTQIAQLAHGAPYEKLRAMNSAEILDILKEVDERADSLARRIAYEHDLQHQIATFNNAADEKVRAIDESNERVRELEDEQTELEEARGFYETLLGMVYARRDSQLYSDKAVPLTYGQYIYVGWETGFNPTFENIAD